MQKYKDVCSIASVTPFPVSRLSAPLYVANISSTCSPNSIRSMCSAVDKQQHALGFQPVNQRVTFVVTELCKRDASFKAEVGGPIFARQFIRDSMVNTCYLNLLSGLSSCVMNIQPSYAAVVFGFVLCLRASSLVHLILQDVFTETDFLVIRVRYRKSLQSFVSRN